MRHRWINRLYAQAMGYFWLPCPLCGQEFGGHEWMTDDPRSCIPTDDPSQKTGICPDCTTRPS